MTTRDIGNVIAHKRFLRWIVEWPDEHIVSVGSFGQWTTHPHVGQKNFWRYASAIRFMNSRRALSGKPALTDEDIHYGSTS